MSNWTVASVGPTGKATKILGIYEYVVVVHAWKMEND